ncbi:TraB/GumN family protein [Paracoccus pacificus]|uniref:TraB/GumN family protein n=1 Tax=Paracoccus pacificus TaxID=1463598 RepID=A0ABW4R8V7_9RHOB
MRGLNWLSALVFSAFSMPAAAEECIGRNLLDAMPPARLAEIRAAADAVPFARGNFWQADKGPNRITLIGTYHFDDPRHDLATDRFRDTVEQADALLVEAGPDEMVRLQAELANRPDLVILTKGPTLRERMTEEDWKKLTAVMKARGIPEIMVAKMQPWYLAMTLSVSPCLLRQIQSGKKVEGLDQRLTDIALAADVPIKALEPWDTAFKLFSDMTPGQEIEMIRMAIPAAELADDYTATLAYAYFSGESRLVWEFSRYDAYENSGLTRDQVDSQAADTEEKLMNRRNESWIAPLVAAADAAAEKDKGVVAAFGALHLSGEKGVLQLLQDQGYTLTPLTVQPSAAGTKGQANGG